MIVMNSIVKCPEWGIKMVTRLCFSHVKEQLAESLAFIQPNPQSFICGGHLYVFIANDLVIAENFIVSEGLRLN
mgnify:CR=1 FL=1